MLEYSIEHSLNSISRSLSENSRLCKTLYKSYTKPLKKIYNNSFNFITGDIYFHCFQSKKNPVGTANSDQNYTVWIILHFSQWGRNLRGFPSPGTNFGPIFQAQ